MGAKSTAKSMLLLGNIGTGATEDGIRELFAGTAGVVTSVSIPAAPSGKNRGYALVEMKNDSEAEQAMVDLNGVSIDGRAMSLTMVPKEQVQKKWYQFGSK